MDAGHVLIGAAGELLSVDAAFCAILQLPDSQIRGRRVLDVTAPADRVECATAIQHLRDTGRPFVITKRLLRDEGSLVWVRNSVSITVGADRDGGTIVATVQPVPPPEERSPATLLNVANLHITMRQDRAAVCDPGYFGEVGWDIVLALYVAEAEGRAMDIERLSVLLNKSVALTQRWIQMLLDGRVVELEYRNPDPVNAKAFRLTSATHEKLEAFLSRDHRAL
jgi:PAS domain S-box-containing protein